LAENTKLPMQFGTASSERHAGDHATTLEGVLRDAGLTELSLREAVDVVERELVLLALLATRGNITHAARHLRITRPTLYSLIRKHGIPVASPPRPVP
jgi:DNA-binding NtrC family response regulator